ncbi:MBL fold metallo-hydrolase [Streptomyces sp. NPDC001680]
MSRALASETTEIGDGVYAYVQPDGSWFLNNTGFITGRQSVIGIDTCATERRTRAFLDAISTVTRQPVRTLVNTHHHADHTFGNFLLPGATVVGHERTRAEVMAFGRPGNRGVWNDVDWGRFELAPPFLTYTSDITLWADDLRCDVRYVGMPAHTTNDSVVHLPDSSVLFAGDLLFKGGTPFVMMGSLSGAIEVLEKVVRPLGAQTIVCGHGPVCGPEVIDDMLAYLRFVEDLARRAKDAGLTPLEAARETDLGPFAEQLDAERIVGNLHRAYAELDGAEPGARIDTGAAYRDMVAYNGGRPLTSHA